ncbi:MAG TPA: hypothetical protein VHR35_10545 [Nocardioides sp.]|jgi:hypothetical protein|nr:hypothetical protein [Nocardioides sp.]
MAVPPTPLRLWFGQMDDAVREHLTALLARYPRRVEVLEDVEAGADLVLVDPYVEGEFDADQFSQRAVGEATIVIYTPRDDVDHLAFAMAGAALDGRLRGWLSAGLGAIALVGSLELIQGGTVVLHGRGRPLTV